MIRRPPSSTRTDPPCPSTTRFRSVLVEEAGTGTDCLGGKCEELADRVGPTGLRSGVGVDPPDDVAGCAVETCITRGDDARPLLGDDTQLGDAIGEPGDRKSTRLNSSH